MQQRIAIFAIHGCHDALSHLTDLIDYVWKHSMKKILRVSEFYLFLATV